MIHDIKFSPATVRRTLLGTCAIALILALTHLGVPDSWVATGAAAAMLLLPWALNAKDPGPALWGSLRRDMKYLLMWSVGTFVPFALCFHLWFSTVMGIHLSPEISTSRIARFQPELRGEAAYIVSQKSSQTPQLRIWEQKGEVFAFVPEDSTPLDVDIRPDNHASVPPPTPRNLLRGKFRRDHLAARTSSWGTRSLKPGQGFSFPVNEATSLTVANPGEPPWLLSTPADEILVKGSSVQEIPKNLLWIPIMLFLHLIAVALPEEYFFRGFVQKNLRDKLPSIKIPFLPGPFPLAIVVSSLLFALVHMVATPHISRLAVFFPSLLFGWLYERSGNLSQPIGYHALSNVVLAIYEMIWFG